MPLSSGGPYSKRYLPLSWFVNAMCRQCKCEVVLKLRVILGSPVWPRVPWPILSPRCYQRAVNAATTCPCPCSTLARVPCILFRPAQKGYRPSNDEACCGRSIQPPSARCPANAPTHPSMGQYYDEATDMCSKCTDDCWDGLATDAQKMGTYQDANRCRCNYMAAAF